MLIPWTLPFVLVIGSVVYFFIALMVWTFNDEDYYYNTVAKLSPIPLLVIAFLLGSFINGGFGDKVIEKRIDGIEKYNPDTKVVSGKDPKTKLVFKKNFGTPAMAIGRDAIKEYHDVAKGDPQYVTYKEGRFATADLEVHLHDPEEK